MSKADVNSISLLKSIFTDTRIHIPDDMKDKVIAALKYFYDGGYYTDEDIISIVKAGSITPEDFTKITGKPYPSNSSTGSAGSNGSNGSNPSK